MKGTFFISLVILFIGTECISWKEVIKSGFTLYSPAVPLYDQRLWFALSFVPETIEGEDPTSRIPGSVWGDLPLMLSRDDGETWAGPIVLPREIWRGNNSLYYGEWDPVTLKQGFDYFIFKDKLFVVGNFEYCPSKPCLQSDALSHIGLLEFSLSYPQMSDDYPFWVLSGRVSPPTIFANTTEALGKPIVSVFNESELDILFFKGPHVNGNDSHIFHVRTSLYDLNTYVTKQVTPDIQFNANYSFSPDHQIIYVVWDTYDFDTPCTVEFAYTLDHNNWSHVKYSLPNLRNVTDAVYLCQSFNRKNVWVDNTTIISFLKIIYITDPIFYREFKNHNVIPDMPSINIGLVALKINFTTGLPIYELIEPFPHITQISFYDRNRMTSYNLYFAAKIGPQMWISFPGNTDQPSQNYTYAYSNITNPNLWEIKDIPQFSNLDPSLHKFGEFKCNPIYCLALISSQGVLTVTKIARVDLVNECLTDPPCNYNTTCIDYIGSSKCSCPPGFSNYNGKGRIDRNCFDVDECKMGVCQRERTCINTIGSFICGDCLYGYRLINDTCHDIDECAEHIDSCQQKCINGTNPPGLYTCGCFEEYELKNQFFCSLTDSAIKNYTIIGVTSGIVFLLIIGAILAAIFLPSYIERQRWADLSNIPEELSYPWLKYQKTKGAGWKKSGHLHYKEIKKGSIDWQVLNGLLNKLGGKDLKIKSAYLLYNNKLVTNFLNQKSIQEYRLRNKEVFFKQNWKEEKNSKKRNWVYKKFMTRVNSFIWNRGSQIPILPAVHGTSHRLAKKIGKTGFAALSTLDSGYFGKGIYFTSSAMYALPYFATKNNPSIIISHIIPGNIYPVIEDHKDMQNSLIGKAIKAGYNSHYVVTRKNGSCESSEPLGEEQLYDEFVIEQEAQIAPAFLIDVEKSSVIQLANEFNRDIPSTSSTQSGDSSMSLDAINLDSALHFDSDEEGDKSEIIKILSTPKDGYSKMYHKILGSSGDSSDDSDD